MLYKRPPRGVGNFWFSLKTFQCNEDYRTVLGFESLSLPLQIDIDSILDEVLL